jgi:two-component system sensor histidine kinase CreC
MMELAAIESRRVLDTLQPVALAALAEEVAASARAAGAPRGVDVRVQAADAAVDGDPFLLRRALANLVDNAVDFSPEGGTVTISIVPRRRSVELRVRDRGPGIPHYASAKVFEKFYSLERPHGRKRSTGLGLAFVKQIAALHGGRVTLANAADGPGAVAVLTLRRAGV